MEFFLSALFNGEFFGVLFKYLRPRVGKGIYRVTHAVYQACVVESLSLENFIDVVGDRALLPVGNVLLYVLHHLHNFNVCAAVLGALQRAERGRH